MSLTQSTCTTIQTGHNWSTSVQVSEEFGLPTTEQKTEIESNTQTVKIIVLKLPS